MTIDTIFLVDAPDDARDAMDAVAHFAHDAGALLIGAEGLPVLAAQAMALSAYLAQGYGTSVPGVIGIVESCGIDSTLHIPPREGYILLRDAFACIGRTTDAAVMEQARRQYAGEVADWSGFDPQYQPGMDPDDIASEFGRYLCDHLPFDVVDAETANTRLSAAVDAVPGDLYWDRVASRAEAERMMVLKAHARAKAQLDSGKELSISWTEPLWALMQERGTRLYTAPGDGGDPVLSLPPGVALTLPRLDALDPVINLKKIDTCAGMLWRIWFADAVVYRDPAGADIAVYPRPVPFKAGTPGAAMWYHAGAGAFTVDRETLEIDGRAFGFLIARQAGEGP